MNYSIQSGKTVEEAVEKALKDLKISRDKATIEVIEEPSKGFLGLIGGKEAIVKVVEKFESKDILESIFDSPSFDRNIKKDQAQENSIKVQVEAKKETIVDEKEEVIQDEAKEAEQIELIQKEKAELKTKEKKIQETQIVDVEKNTIEEETKTEEVERIDISEEEKNSIIEEYISKVMASLSIEYDLKIEHKDRMIFVSIDGKKEETGIVIGKRGVTLDSIQYILSLILNSKTEVYNRVILDCSNYREKREATLENLAQKMAKKALHSNRSVRLEPMTAQERRIIHAALGSVEGVSTHSEGKEPYRRVVIQKERKY